MKNIKKRKLNEVSELQYERLKFRPILPDILNNCISNIVPDIIIKKTKSISNQHEIKNIFKNTYGLPIIKFIKNINSNINIKKKKVAVVFSGGPAPGGHNVIVGLFNALKNINKNNRLFGYINGFDGVLKNNYIEIFNDTIIEYINTGGFDLIGSSRTKIESIKHLNIVKNNLEKCFINALVIVGGDDSNTNAAIISEYFLEKKIDICVIGIPKTIDGDLKNKYIETSFGFDTATKVYSELVGNICRDAKSSKKHWHFIRLMGRSASHIALEVGLKTHPNILLIGEEILAKNIKLNDLIEYIVNIISMRFKKGKNFGIIIIPEGLIEFIPDIREFIFELNNIIFKNYKNFSRCTSVNKKKQIIFSKIHKKFYYLKSVLYDEFIEQLLLDRDVHGNVVVSCIETEKFLVKIIRNKIKNKFSPITHFFGYEGRCSMPSNFDANYSYSLGYNSAFLIFNNLSGYMSYVKNLIDLPKNWECGGVPITMMMNIEKRNGIDKAVIQKTLVDLNGKSFNNFLNIRDQWILNEDYIFPGPIQYFGCKKITNMTVQTLKRDLQKNKKKYI
jgi:pyrophosphate--fructose-6-phosphate 1-phosphotransferase